MNTHCAACGTASKHPLCKTCRAYEQGNGLVGLFGWIAAMVAVVVAVAWGLA